MAHKQTRTAKAEKAHADVVIENSAVSQELERVQAEAFAKTAGVVIETAEPVAEAAETVMAESADTAELLAPLEPVVEAAPAADPIITEAAEAVVTAAEKVETTAKKEWTTMATQFEAPKMITDMNDRAKASFEKTQKFAAEFGDFSKGNIEAMVESSKIAAKGIETMGQDAAEYTRRSFEGMTATIKSLATIKSPTEFFKLQSDYMRSAFDAAVAQSSKNTEAMIKLSSDAAQPISNRVAVAVEKVKMAA
jgi:phasin family protein